MRVLLGADRPDSTLPRGRIRQGQIAARTMPNVVARPSKLPKTRKDLVELGGGRRGLGVRRRLHTPRIPRGSLILNLILFFIFLACFTAKT